jgi:GNAT superfamily N-acetyltransferase
LPDASASPWVIERFGKDHDRSAFNCGHAALDDWLKLRASQFEKKDLARTYVALRSGDVVAMGYYSLATHRVTYEALPDDQAKGIPRIDVPVVLLARLAVDRKVQGQGLGSALLLDAMRRAERLSFEVGVRAMEVDAIDEAARTWYLRFGFVSLVDDPNHLFLPMKIIRKLGLQ